MAVRAAKMAQVNIRMDQGLKRAGDTVLAQMGISPTQLVRAVWAKVACGAQACEQLVRVLAEAPTTSDGLAAAGEEAVGDVAAPTSRFDMLRRRQETLSSELGLNLASFVPHGDEELTELLCQAYFEEEELV